MKRKPTNPLPVYSGKKRKTGKDKTQEPKSEGKRQMLIEECLAKTIPHKRNRVTFSTIVTVRHVTLKGMLSVRTKLTCLVEEEDIAQRQSTFKTRRQRVKQIMHLRHESRKQENTPRLMRIRRHVLDTIRHVNLLNL